MRRIVTVLLAITLVPGAILLGRYGLFLIEYSGDFPGANPKLFVGSLGIDTDIVGAVLVGAAIGMLLSAFLLVRRAYRSRFASPS